MLNRAKNEAQGCVVEYQHAAEFSAHPKKTFEKPGSPGGSSCIESVRDSDKASSNIEPIPNPFPGVMPANRCTESQMSSPRYSQVTPGTPRPDSELKEQGMQGCNAANHPTGFGGRADFTGEEVQEEVHQGVELHDIGEESMKEQNEVGDFPNDLGESRQAYTRVRSEVGGQQAQSGHWNVPEQSVESIHVPLRKFKNMTACLKPHHEWLLDQQTKLDRKQAEIKLQVCSFRASALCSKIFMFCNDKK